ncbi:hypothetical protein [Ruminococcus sp.]|uniref:hypothetical protein n=1 Tax=Ruminococcus sp. TaxID=41978 RepID=UPI001B671EFD|nr:hypothetical protein [Ruminococcus sp.]MBP5433767.1 hypothetical protein [Ruminococcus sp.]
MKEYTFDGSEISEEELDKQAEALWNNIEYMRWLAGFANIRLHGALDLLEIASKFLLSASFTNSMDYAQGRAIAHTINDLLEEERKLNE